MAFAPVLERAQLLSFTFAHGGLMSHPTDEQLDALIRETLGPKEQTEISDSYRWM